MNLDTKIRLEVLGKISVEHLLSVLAIGTLRCLQTGSMTVEDAHVYLFNPVSEKIVKKLNVDEALKTKWNSALFLEDLEEMYDAGKFADYLKKYEQEWHTLAKSIERTEHKNAKWLKNTLADNLDP